MFQWQLPLQSQFHSLSRSSFPACLDGLSDSAHGLRSPETIQNPILRISLVSLVALLHAGVEIPAVKVQVLKALIMHWVRNDSQITGF